MSKKTNSRLSAGLFATAAICALSACGGGGGGGGQPGTVTPPPPPPPASVSFTVSLDSIDIRRASNGESIAVDVSGVTQDLTYQP